MSCRSIVRLGQGKVSYAGGEILFEGKNTLEMSEKELRKIRGKDIAIIFQEPMTALNPLYTIGDQMIEALKNHQKISTRQAREDVYKRQAVFLIEIGFQEIVIKAQVLSHIRKREVSGDAVLNQAVSVHSFDGARDADLGELGLNHLHYLFKIGAAHGFHAADVRCG